MVCDRGLSGVLGDGTRERRPRGCAAVEAVSCMHADDRRAGSHPHAEYADFGEQQDLSGGHGDVAS